MLGARGWGTGPRERASDRIVYGRPEEAGGECGASHVVVELLTPGYAVRRRGGFRLEVPGSMAGASLGLLR
jgi:hypothetical protein